jgi:hypothetical protein
MNIPLKSLLAATTLLVATPALADVAAYKTNYDQGILVHNNGGAADTGTLVEANLGGGPGGLQNYVNFDGSTTFTGDTTDANALLLQNGAGQAELEGAVISGNTNYQLQSGDIYLDNNDGMTWIELAFTGVTADTITFTLSLLGEPDAMFTLDVNHDPNGENKYGFLAYNGELITNLNYVLNGGTAASIRQIRILQEGGTPPPTVPEPATWGMMLLGFGAVGVAMRRRRKTYLPQVA